MPRFRSLRSRITVLTTVPLIAILVVTLWTTMNTANSTVRRSVHKSLSEAGAVFVQLLTTRKAELVSMAQVTVRDPRFFALFSIPPDERGHEFRPTLEGISIDFLRITDADFMEIFDRDGRFVTCVELDGPRTDGQRLADGGREGIKQAMKGAVVSDFYQADEHLVVAAVAPVYAAQRLEAVIRLGRFLDERFAGEVKRLTGADVCLARDGRGFASTFPGGADGEWLAAAAATGFTGESVTLGDAFELARGPHDFLATHIHVDGVSSDDGFDVFIGRELQAALGPVVFMETRVAVGGLIAVLVTLAVGFLIANSISRPLTSIVQASTALQRGEYDYPIDMRGSDEVARLGQNFAAMRESLKEYVEHLKSIDQAKSNFIALAGHELRTPLTVISGFNEMIVSGALGEVPDKVQETTGIINEQLTDLNRLVQSMLDLTYFEQGLHALAPSDTDLNVLVRDAVSRRQAALARRDLDLKIVAGEPAPWSRVDRERMDDAVLHLLDNAIRYTPDGGRVTVSTSADDEHAYIVVEDTGVGIPHNEIKWIFDKIYEVGDVMHHSSGRHRFGSKGFGLGLALCKAIVDAHGGTIRVDSTPGRGSRFSIVLSRVERNPEPVDTHAQGVLV